MEDIVYISGSLDTRLESRRIKCLLLEIVQIGDIVVWLDDNIHPTRIVRNVVEQAVSRHDIAASKHPDRDCIYDEVEVCRKWSLDYDDRLRGQGEAYLQAQHPKHWGLWELGVLIRRRTPKMYQLGRMWWNEIQRHSIRDQISFPFIARTLGVEVNALPHLFRGNQLFARTPFTIHPH